MSKNAVHDVPQLKLWHPREPHLTRAAVSNNKWSVSMLRSTNVPAMSHHTVPWGHGDPAQLFLRQPVSLYCHAQDMGAVPGVQRAAARPVIQRPSRRGKENADINIPDSVPDSSAQLEPCPDRCCMARFKHVCTNY